MITETKLPKKDGYIETTDLAGNHIYRRVLKNMTKVTKVIKESMSFEIPDTAEGTIIVQLIGGGGSISCDLNGDGGEFKSEIFNIKAGTIVDIHIGQAGSDGSCGEPTSFGQYLSANGGQSGVLWYRRKNKPFVIEGNSYGKGESKSNRPTDGVCVISYYI